MEAPVGPLPQGWISSKFGIRGQNKNLFFFLLVFLNFYPQLLLDILDVLIVLLARCIGEYIQFSQYTVKLRWYGRSYKTRDYFWPTRDAQG